MDIVHPRVTGIDVHKKVVWVAVRLPGAAPGERTVVTKSLEDVLAVAAEDGGLAVRGQLHPGGGGGRAADPRPVPQNSYSTSVR